MTDDRWQRVKDLFGEAASMPTQLREGFLEETCEGDPGLRREVEGLLAHHTTTDVTRCDVDPASAGPSEEPGTVIDRYRLQEPIGEGGMGSVWMAEQLRPVKRQVALKIIKLGMDTKEVVARFEAERQALALMDHPHIAKVLDGGATATGRPYFVMELVRGVPITEYCDDVSLGTSARLELFRQVCHAVQHAHTKGIIHRDIKPGNVLVTLHDGVPVPKVIDFGIAKATDQSLTERTYFTRFRQVIGTPESMAPEQAEMSGLDIDARADIYSLGVLLYELLTGTKPFSTAELGEAGYEAMLRTIREVEPPKPSTRVGTLAGATLAGVAARRGETPTHLGRRFVGDLDWIVMKAMEKDRTRRYETAASLADDVSRHLRDEPVEARRPGALYLFGKFARRHRAGVVAASVAMLALLVGAAAAAVAYREMHREWEQSLEQREVALSEREQAEAGRRQAEAEWRQADQQRVREARKVDFFSRMIAGQPLPAAGREAVADWSFEVAPGAPGGTGIHYVLERALNEVDLAFIDDPEAAFEVEGTLGMALVHHGYMDQAASVLPEAVARGERARGEGDPQVLALRAELTDALVATGRTEEAIDNQRKLIAIQTRRDGPDGTQTFLSISGMASAMLDAGMTQEAEDVLNGLLLTRAGQGDAAAPPGFEVLQEDVFLRGDAPFAVPGLHVAGEVPFVRTVAVARDGAQRVIMRSSSDSVTAVEETLLADRVAKARRPGALARDKNAAAWALLTTPTVALRDPGTALDLARDACQATGHADPVLMDTLSLALFRSGDADGAVANQHQALELLSPTQTLLRADMLRNLDLFEGRISEEELYAPLFERATGQGG